MKPVRARGRAMRWTVCRCGFYIYWIKHTAGYITGFPYHTLLDVNPLIQLPVYLALPVVGLALLQRRRRAAWPRIGGAAPWQAILFVAIALQAGWSTRAATATWPSSCGWTGTT